MSTLVPPHSNSLLAPAPRLLALLRQPSRRPRSRVNPQVIPPATHQNTTCAFHHELAHYGCADALCDTGYSDPLPLNEALCFHRPPKCAPWPLPSPDLDLNFPRARLRHSVLLAGTRLRRRDCVAPGLCGPRATRPITPPSRPRDPQCVCARSASRLQLGPPLRAWRLGRRSRLTGDQRQDARAFPLASPSLRKRTRQSSRRRPPPVTRSGSVAGPRGRPPPPTLADARASIGCASFPPGGISQRCPPVALLSPSPFLLLKVSQSSRGPLFEEVPVWRPGQIFPGAGSPFPWPSPSSRPPIRHRNERPGKFGGTKAKLHLDSGVTVSPPLSRPSCRHGELPRRLLGRRGAGVKLREWGAAAVAQGGCCCGGKSGDPQQTVIGWGSGADALRERRCGS